MIGNIQIRTMLSGNVRGISYVEGGMREPWI